jgi:hypothetical protein
MIEQIYKGKFVTVEIVDETTEITVENNVYSRSEAIELAQELLDANDAVASHFYTNEDL